MDFETASADEIARWACLNGGRPKTAKDQAALSQWLRDCEITPERLEKLID